MCRIDRDEPCLQPIARRLDGPSDWHKDHPHTLDGECLHGYDEVSYDGEPRG